VIEVGVHPADAGLFVAVCTSHGVLAYWTTEGMAAWHALGHATHHHG
jgi:hypothetical protein